MLKIVGVLTLVCVLCAFFLSLAAALAEKKTKANAKEKIKTAIVNLAKEAVIIKEIKIDDEIIYNLLDKFDNSIGYAFSAQGQGYQGKIKLLAVANPSLGFLAGIEVVESLETPGLGAKIQESAFKEQFNKLSILNEIELLKQEPTKGSQIKAITGATVSSRAVVNILNKRLEKLKEQISNLK